MNFIICEIHKIFHFFILLNKKRTENSGIEDSSRASERFVVFGRVLDVLASTAGSEADERAAVVTVRFVVDLAVVGVHSAEHHVLLRAHLAVHAVHIYKRKSSNV